jgi:hypothetical protein
MGDNIGGYVKQNYGANKRYYYPLDVGEEKRLKQFLKYLEQL